MSKENLSLIWSKLIENRRNNCPFFRSRTCHIYNHRSRQPPDNPKQTCPCGRFIGRHSLTDACLESEAGETWIPPTKFDDNEIHSCQVMINVYGTLKPHGCNFLRMDNRINNDNLNELYYLILEDCGGKKPSLIVNISGGAKYFVLKEQLQTEVVEDIIDIAAKADAWILTDGTNTGISKLIGEGISHYRILHNYSNKIKCIGLTMWGSLNEEARRNLKKSTPEYPEELLLRQIPFEKEEDENRIEENHTHCILFDDGRLNGHLTDLHRDKFIVAACNDSGSTCYAITIIFGGDLTELKVFENDIQNKRPIILIQGSGRLTDMLTSLLELTSNSTWNKYWNPTDGEIRTAFDSYFPSYTDQESIDALNRIRNILDKKNRYLFNIFSFDRGSTLTTSVFNAILSAKKIGKEEREDSDIFNDSPEVKRSLHENRLLELAFQWDYISGATPILQRWQDEILNKKLNMFEKHEMRENELFKKCLEHNRPAFIDFFLTAGFDPRDLTKTKNYSECEQIIWQLYNQCRQSMSERKQIHIASLFGRRSPDSKEHIYRKLHKFIGPFVHRMDIRSSHNSKKHICIDFNNCMHYYRRWKQHSHNQFDTDTIILNEINIEKEYGKDQMLRDLFLWSVFMNMPDMAKVLLVHVQSRICASLIASAIFKQYAKLADTVYLEEKLRTQALNFEIYAATCIDKCYEFNERTACELLYRQVPLFGYVTCMQIAISSKSEKLLQTACFDQALKLVWYNQLALSNSQLKTKPFLFFSAILFGFPAPIAMEYRKPERHSIIENISFDLSLEGINYYNNEEDSKNWSCSKYWCRFRYFHESPVVKMYYHFISYVFFLLIFSYMMLYHIDNPAISKIHWTEIYVIVTVTTMLLEEIREILYEYHAQMLELSITSESSIQTWIAKSFIILPYILFYLGIGLQFSSKNNDDVLISARIILAFDLEIWYLQSLRFIIAFKFLGPKLFMLKNMLCDLFAFVYLIFIAIIAYGVVSRSLLFYKQIPFTAHGIFKGIFYAPYWFLYTNIADKDYLDERIQNETHEFFAEATATEILLCFHMLFVNILLLNLLIAVFADTIGKVQQNTEFFWRYQRYSFVREYFLRPILAYPPLTIIPHIILLSYAIKNKFFSIFKQNPSTSKIWTPVFKMIPKTDGTLDIHWNMFENAATHKYARSILEKNKKRNVLSLNENILEKTTMATTVLNSDAITTNNVTENLTSIKDENESISSIKEDIILLKSAFSEIQQDLNKIIASQHLLIETISHSKSN
ncbi:hypothetical protein I4U23_016083 [Adineta vaga]|nr:hypothetical protein I4U23_016083 [Adineta vaga]